MQLILSKIILEERTVRRSERGMADKIEKRRWLRRGEREERMERRELG